MAKTEEEVYVTKQGLEDMKKELDYLQTVKRPEVIKTLKEARALGDLSENAEYDAARDAQSQTESRIIELSNKIANAKVIESKGTDKVSIGSCVKIEYLEDKETDEYTIVGSTEADPFENRISNESPIATAILGKKQGETVAVASPNGEYHVKILNIK